MSVDDSADMRDFGSSLINKEEKVPFPENMKISMFISTGSISKLGGPFTTLLSADGVDAFSSEIITYSFGFTLSKGTDEYHKQFGCDITYMTKFSYEDEFEIVLTLPVVNTYAKLPLDYRNEDEFKNHKSALLHLV
ncbi:MAG: hypothetical protein LKE89_03895 [Lactobacillaceae bacterium]|jgi:hypothetical protein|nr:hypothetical protein [Lactobacillaceae bacterium]